jgi:hypothetical protein
MKALRVILPFVIAFVMAAVATAVALRSTDCHSIAP